MSLNPIAPLWTPTKEQRKKERRRAEADQISLPRMRSSTILIVNLKSLAAETIKNVVLAGIGRLIVSRFGIL